MEPKKNPKYDVHQHRGVIMNLSLAISFIVVIVAFRWGVPMPSKPDKPKLPKIAADEDWVIIPVTSDDKKNETEKQKSPKPKPLVIAQVVEAQMKNELQKYTGAIDQNEPPAAYEPGDIVIEIPPDTVVYFEGAVEKKPEPLGGYEAFAQLLRKNLKYPRLAQKKGTQGKVFVSFTVDKTGELTDIKVLKGIGDGCDEEAVRVIKLSTWSPGKQRGKPVRVRMVQPISFHMN